MGYTLERLAAECRRLLADNPGVAGREKLRRLIEQVLADEAFLARHLREDGG
jgi:hypothetical protein